MTWSISGRFCFCPRTGNADKIICQCCKKINAVFKISSQVRSHNEVMNNNILALKGKAPSHADPSYYNPNDHPVIYEDPNGCNGMRFEVLLKAINKDGSVTIDTSGIHVSNATEVVLVLSAATSFNGFDKCPDKDGKDENKLAFNNLSAALKNRMPFCGMNMKRIITGFLTALH